MAVSLPDTEVAWAAGFFDGEGNSGLTKEGYFRINLGQTEITTLERFCAALDLPRSKIYGPYEKKQANWSAIYMLQVAGRPASTAIDRLWPYLSGPKRDQAVQHLALARVPHRPGFCKKDLHELTTDNRTSEGRCRTCRSTYQRNKGRVAP